MCRPTPAGGTPPPGSGARLGFAIHCLIACARQGHVCRVRKHVLFSGHITVIKNTFYFEERAILCQYSHAIDFNQTQSGGKRPNREMIWMQVGRFIKLWEAILIEDTTYSP